MTKAAIKKIIVLLLIIIVGSFQLGYLFPVKELWIPSTGVISKSPAFSPLHIGTAENGENPCFFYDEHGKLVTIRILGQYDFWPGYGTYWNCINEQIKINKNVSANCFRVQLYPERLFVADRRVGWENDATVAAYLNELVRSLRNIVGNNSYYILTWYFVGDPPWLPNWWITEANNTSIFWNQTVQQDFIWMLNQTFSRIHMEPINNRTLLDYMVYWSFNEWLWTEGVMTAQIYVGDSIRNPWRFGGRSDYYEVDLTPVESSRDVAQKSWIAWLEERYNNDISLLKDAWNTTDSSGKYNSPETVRYWNYSGLETNDFESLLMPNGTGWGYFTGRQYDFTMWYHECMLNFTGGVRNWIKSIYPNINYGADTYCPITSENSAAMWTTGFNPASLSLVGDVLIYHIYGTYPISAQGWFQGDNYETLWMELGALGRAAKKPSFVDECGFSPNWNQEAESNWKLLIAGYQNVSTSLAIQNGLAGMGQWYGCVRWYSTNGTAWRTQEYQQIIKAIFDKYKAAENWIDKIRYDKVCVVEHIGGKGLSRYLLEWLKEAGYCPAYKVIAWNETHFIPAIPSDTEVIIADPSLNGNIYIANGTVSAYNKLIDEGKKLIIFGVRKGGSVYWKGFNTHWEQQISSDYLPIRDASLGSNYRYDEGNNTELRISVYGGEVTICRNASNGWDARNTVMWNDADITGTRLINCTNGQWQNGNPQPLCLINNYTAWISVLLGETSEIYETGDYVGGVKRDDGYGLIFKAILEYWLIRPVLDISVSSSTTGKVEVTYANLESDYSVLVINNRDFERDAFAFKLNIAESGMDPAYTYFIFSEENETIMEPFTSASLQTNEITLNIPANYSSIFVLRRNDLPSFIYSTIQHSNEKYTGGILSLILFSPSEIKIAISIYRVGLEIRSCEINGQPASYSISNGLVTISADVKEGYSPLVISFS